MDIGKLLAGKFEAKETAESTAKATQASRIRSELEWKEYNREALKRLFEPIIKSFNATIQDRVKLSLEIKGFDMTFSLGFNVVLLIKIGEAHVELSRGGVYGRYAKPLTPNFFFISYTERNEPIFSQSYHIESAWIAGEEFATHCLKEALQIEG
ncbi:MAG TPA: hypothetical protein VGN16_01145 [Acidobacteriaceae bacterium]|jgi:hypothetical protein